MINELRQHCRFIKREWPCGQLGNVRGKKGKRWVIHEGRIQVTVRLCLSDEIKPSAVISQSTSEKAHVLTIWCVCLHSCVLHIKLIFFNTYQLIFFYDKLNICKTCYNNTKWQEFSCQKQTYELWKKQRWGNCTFFFFFDAFLKTCHNRVTFLFIRQLLPDWL